VQRSSGSVDETEGEADVAVIAVVAEADGADAADAADAAYAADAEDDALAVLGALALVPASSGPPGAVGSIAPDPSPVCPHAPTTSNAASGAKMSGVDDRIASSLAQDEALRSKFRSRLPGRASRVAARDRPAQ
jgi:hypothetical protein